jgi:hypothetical protein
MKTFDGNPLEHTPASNHTDHAVAGYAYTIRLLNASGHVLLDETISVQDASSFRTGYRFANIGHQWYLPYLEGYPDSHLEAFLRRVLDLGFDGISVEVNYFLGGSQLDQVFPQYTRNPDVHPWILTAHPDQVRRLLRTAERVGLQSDVRFSIWIAEEAKQQASSSLDRCCFVPSSSGAFFENYTEQALELAAIAEEGGAEYFTPIVEWHGLMQAETEIRSMLDAVDAVFSGRIIVEDHFSMVLQGLHEQHLIGDEAALAREMGTFWDWVDASGQPLIIGLNPWPLAGIYETTLDQRYSVISKNAVSHWSWAVAWLRRSYPEHEIVFAEIGAFNVNGGAVDWISRVYASACERDDQELADTWRAFFDTITVLDLHGASLWAYSYYAYTSGDEKRACRVYLNDTLAELVLAEFLR